MSSPFVGEIRPFPFNFAPRGWAFCDGQLLPISQNTALFSLLGTMYGGDGRSTFALPNLQGAAAMHTDQYSGGGQHPIGSSGGTDAVTLLTSELPAHTHTISAYVGRGANAQSPESDVVLSTSQGNEVYGPAGSAAALDPNTVGIAGGSSPHNNRMPTLYVNYCIAMQGIFPPRS